MSGKVLKPFIGAISRDYYKLSVIRQYREYKPGFRKLCEGFDTETKDGYARIAATSDRWQEINSFEDVMDFLTQKRSRSTMNVFFNIGFDFEVLFKWRPKVLRDLVKSNSAKWKGWTLRSIPNKFFSLQDKNRNVYTYYDIAQFYHTSLPKAAKNILNKEAHPLKGDRAWLFELHPIERIGEYCAHDSYLTKLLAENYLDSIERMGLTPKKLLSAGYIAKQFMLRNADIPTVYEVPRVVAALYWRAYSGGWFDTYKRGTFTADHYDLKSAYPAVMRELPDIREGAWKPGYQKDGLMGVYKVELSNSPNDFLPIGGDWLGARVYPTINEPVTAYLTKGEYEVLKKDYQIRIEYGYTFHQDGEIVKPFKEIVDKAFKLKEANRKNPGVYQATKELINSFYGNCAEKRRDKETGITLTGNLFNPVYAAEITARVRMKLYQDCKHMEKKIISIATDSVIVESPSKLSCSGLLGGWCKEHRDQEVLVLQSGVYQFRGEQSATRGFQRSTDLFKSVNSASVCLKTTKLRPKHYKECIRTRKYAEIGVFTPVEKRLNLNRDLKRDWDQSVRHLSELLKGGYGSKPKDFSLWK